ncbi:MAG: BolA family protein [Aestuariivirga sp.]
MQAALAPHALQVIDESNQHIGHAGAHPSGESHFRVRISSQAFAGKSLLQKHRMVNEAVAEELKSRVHALAIEVLS